MRRQWCHILYLPVILSEAGLDCSERYQSWTSSWKTEALLFL
jgi:hypothetical protein